MSKNVKSAFPIVGKPEVDEWFGLSKREYIATHIMASCSGLINRHYPEDLATWSVSAADALIKELEKGKLNEIPKS